MRIGAFIGIAIWKLPTLCISKNLFMRGFMMDGNFQVEHMRMKNPEDDIPLSDGAGFLLTINPAPSERGMSSSGFFILMCSTWKLPSIIKPRIKRFLLIQSVGSFQIVMPINTPILILSPIFREVDSRLCAQGTEYSHRTRLWIFIFTIPKTESLSSNESSPLSADP